MLQRHAHARQRNRRLAEASRASNAAGTERCPQPPAVSVAPFSVIIPALDEERALPDALTHLNVFREVDDVIVVDGGSLDGTVEVAQAAGARVVRAARGRGPQMNAGARAARNQHLLFLHADCRLPQDAFRAIQEVYASGYDAGLFSIDFGSRHVVLRTMSFLSRWPTPWTQFGEGALFMRRHTFEALGGFPDWPLMEDVEMLRRLRRRAQLGRARGTVRASPRRFLQKGVWRQTLRNLFCFALFHVGIPPQRLVHWYTGETSRPVKVE